MSRSDDLVEPPPPPEGPYVGTRHEGETCSRCGTTKAVGRNCAACNWPGPDTR